MAAREKQLETILVIILGLLGAFFLFKSPWWVAAALLIGVLSLASAFFLSRITWAWGKLTALLGLINGTILLSLVYFLLLCPLAYLYRLRHPGALQLKRKKNGSYFITRNHTFRARDLENMW